MAFPPTTPSLGDTAEDIDVARRVWTEAAHAVLAFEPVTMVVDPEDVAVARRMLSSEIELVEQPLDDAWMRDIGLTFVLDEAGRLGGVDWTFNGWGGQAWASWDRDSKVAAAMVAGKLDVGALAGLPALTVERTGGRLLTSAVELKILSPSGTFATTRSYIQRNRTVVERLTRSFVEAIHFLKTNRTGSITLLQKYFGGLSAEETAYLYDDQAELLERLPAPNDKAPRRCSSARPIQRPRTSPRRTSSMRVFLEKSKRAA